MHYRLQKIFLKQYMRCECFFQFKIAINQHKIVVKWIMQFLQYPFQSDM